MLNFRKSTWIFSKIPKIENYKFNDSLNRFFEHKINGLVKENIQNSLDAGLECSSDPVVVKIEMGEIAKNSLPGFEELEPHISSLKGGNDYTRNTIKHLQHAIRRTQVPYISFEDINTKGLSVIRDNSGKSTWDIYAYNTGLHAEDEDKISEMKRGGSHGVGKIASNAASDIYLMYFANCDNLGNQHLGGTIQLIEHSVENNGKQQCYRSTGYFTAVDDDQNFIPGKNYENGVFKKDQRGLKIIVPFFRDTYFNDGESETEVIKTVCDNFFLAILREKLVVHVNDQVIDKTTIYDITHNQQIYEQDVSLCGNRFTPFYIDTIMNTLSQEIKVLSKNNSYTFKLYLQHYPESKKGRVAIFRTIGMKIEDFTRGGNIGFATKPFIGLLVGGLKEDQFLKELENEAHDKLTSAHIADKERQLNGTRFINNLAREINKIIEEELSRLNPTDGKIDTSDLLYIIESKFKKDLKKSYEKIQVNKKKSINKLADPSRQKRTKGEKKGTVKVKATPVKRSGNEQGGSLDGLTQSFEYFQVGPGAVNRVLVGNSEILQLDFSKLAKQHEFSKFNLSMKIVDGEGKKNNDFRLEENFSQVIDKHTNRKLKIKNGRILNVESLNNIANLEIHFSPNYNRSLKFLYYVEV